MKESTFEWDERKNLANQKDHGVSFEEAQYAFFDKCRLIAHDEKHSAKEERWFCIGKVGGADFDRSIYLSTETHPHLWGRMLEKMEQVL